MKSSRGGYLVTEQDGTQHLPTEKDGAPDHGLCGAAWAALHEGYRGQQYDGPDKDKALARLKAIYTRMKWALPAAAGETAHGQVVAFADTAASATQELVRKSGLIFKAGTYAEDDLVVTAADLDGTVAAFTPVPLELEHINTFGQATLLDGKLGRLEAVWHDGSGNLFGTVAVPTWLDPFWADAGRKVSAVLHKASKEVRRLGLVLNPRVPEAAMMGAYTAFAEYAAFAETAADALSYGDLQSLLATALNERYGGRVSADGYLRTLWVQEVYPDRCVYCDPESSELYEVPYSLDADHAVTLGERTKVLRRTVYEPVTFGQKVAARATGALGAFAGRRHSRQDMAALQQIHDITTDQGAACEAPATMSASAPPREGKKTMPLNFKFWAKLTPQEREDLRAAGAEGPPEEAITVVQQEAAFAREQATTEAVAALEARTKEAEARTKQAEEAMFAAMAMRAEAEGAGYIDAKVRDGQLLPAEKPALVAQYRQAALDDAAGLATFSTEGAGKVSRVEQLKASIDARPKLTLLGEQMAVQEGAVAAMGARPSGETDPDKPLDQKGKDDLLAQTELGRRILAQRQAAAGHAN